MLLPVGTEIQLRKIDIMAKTYAEIQKEIAALQKAAESLREKEIAGVIERIKVAIATYGLSAGDLGFSGQAGGSPKAAKGLKRRAGTAPASRALFKDPDSGKTWSGRGRRPVWFSSALAAGKKAEELRA
jgi:DNA-binding protein H-NS